LTRVANGAGAVRVEVMERRGPICWLASAKRRPWQICPAIASDRAHA
jgi:hypothetical protein